MTDDHRAILSLHDHCDRGMSGYVYPDGRAVLDQPLALLDAFAVISAAKAEVRRGEKR